MNNNLNYFELKPENNTFYSLVADITHKCNMKCKNCYIPNRDFSNMKTDKLFDLLKNLPFKTEIRLMGAEPTMREDLPEIISKVREYNHRPVLITNGLKLANLKYVKLLKEAGLFVVNISLNGGFNDKIYKTMDGRSCAKYKKTALENCITTGFFINTNTIIMRGVNESVPFEIYNELQKLNVKRAVMRFRNVGQIGRYMMTKNYSFTEILNLFSKTFHFKKTQKLSYNKIDGYEEKNTLLFPVKTGESIYIKLTDWSSKNVNCPDPSSKRRGRITQEFKIAPFFEHVKRNEFGY